MSQPSQPKDTPCDICGRTFVGQTGLKIHKARVHKPNVVLTHTPAPPPSPSVETELSDNILRLRRSSRIIRRVPQSVRIPIALELGSLLHECAVENSANSWKRLLTFPHAVLDRSGPRNRKQSLSSRLRSNISAWKSQSHDTPNPPTKNTASRRVTSSDSQKDSSARRSRQVEAKVADGDIRGAVRLLSSSEDIAEFSTSTLQALKLKHPARSSPLTIPEPPPTPPLVVTDKEVKKAIVSFPPGSAGGPDGLRAQHLKDLTTKPTGDAGSKVMEGLVDITNLILSGEVPSQVCPVLYGASLVALKKKDGGIRPIASGVTYRRIAAKVACATINTEIGASLRPQQMGFGTPCGSEALVHATTGFLTLEQPGLLLKLDFRNAFNSVNRSRVLECARDRTPHLFPAIIQAYGSPSLLFFGDHSTLRRDYNRAIPLLQHCFVSPSTNL